MANRRRTLKEIAIDLLEKYKEAEAGIIWDYSGRISEFLDELEAEVKVSGRKSRRQSMSDLIDTIQGRGETLMKWQAEQKGYTCNDCYLSMQNCHDRSICCEDETGLCDYFEEMPREDTIRRQDAINAALTFLVEYCGAAFDEHMQTMLCDRLDALPSVEPKHGTWIQKHPNSSWFECSECGATCLGGLKSGKLFCNNCGADMRTDNERFDR